MSYLTNLLTACFLAYFGSGIYSIYNLYYPEQCPIDYGDCIRSLVEVEPKLEMHVYVSKKKSSTLSNLNMIWNSTNFTLDEPWVRELEIPIPESTRNNGTLYMQIYVMPPLSGIYDGRAVLDKKLITRHMIPKPTAFRLVGKGEETVAETAVENSTDNKQPITHWLTKITFSGLGESFAFYRTEIPGEVYPLLRVPQQTRPLRYMPIVFFDKLATRASHFVPLNKSADKLNITLIYSPVSVGKIRLWKTLEGSMEQLKSFGFNEKDLDEMKGIFTDTSIYLLLLTMSVSVLHLLFDALAFKNDITFWRARKTMTGLSSRVVIWRSTSTFIIFLYLIDEDTSLLVSVPAGIGTLIELWKVKKAFKISYKFPFSLSMDRTRTSAEEETEGFDKEAMRYLSYVLYPLCIAGAVYSLIYTPHRGWYSWAINSLVNGVYAFGFIFMLPQLFVNYKLKSVAHLPWRAFMYKAFNTFIDDIFAFIITMPTAHRLACFRDDVVFVAYLYQRWLYPVDKSRVNEYGQSFDEPKEQAVDENSESKKTQ